MKLTLALALGLSLPAIAGAPSKHVIPPPAEPSLWSWFAGGSVGYLVDFEEPMYHLHLGVDTPWNVGGFDVALFAEIGYTESDRSQNAVLIPRDSLDQDLEIIPLTFNVKFERPLTNNLAFYIGAGAGVAFVDYSSKYQVPTAPPVLIRTSRSDTVFAAQLFTGVVFNATENLEIYGGARWIYIDDDATSGATLDFSDDILLEAGVRINF